MFLTTSHFLNSRFLHGHVAGSIIESIKFNKPSELKRRVSGGPGARTSEVPYVAPRSSADVLQGGSELAPWLDLDRWPGRQTPQRRSRNSKNGIVVYNTASV